MGNEKVTKRALTSSVVAILLCVAMLVGTTFAWFTDSASTSVNTVQAGTLDVQLLNADGTASVEGQSLAWVKAAGHEAEATLWEPGCTYELPGVIIKNAGNLALKYKILINGVDGDSRLLDAIDWTYTIGGATLDLTAEGKLGATESSGVIVISGHMREEAGNEYQGLSISGISITVVATQDTVESDSYSSTYDANATLPIMVSTPEEIASAFNGAAAGTSTTVILADDVAIEDFDGNALTVPAGASINLELNGNTLSGTSDGRKADGTAEGTSLLSVVKGATMTVSDTVGTGKISFEYTGVGDGWAAIANTISNNGTLNIVSGTVENTTHDGDTFLSGKVYSAIDNLTNGNAAAPVLNIYGGTISCPTSYAVRMFCNGSVVDNMVNIYGGSLTGNRGIYLQVAGGSVNLANLHIEGGTIYGNKYGIAVENAPNKDNAAAAGTIVLDISSAASITSGVCALGANIDDDNLSFTGDITAANFTFGVST